MEMVSHTRPDCLVVVTDMLDNQKKPVVVAIKPDGHGYYLNAEIPANIALSGYGKDGFKNYIIKAFSEKRILYCDYAKSHQLQQIPGVQFPNNLPHGDFTATIAEFAERVKKNREAKKQNSVPRAAISNEEYWETNELNEERDALRRGIHKKEKPIPFETGLTSGYECCPQASAKSAKTLAHPNNKSIVLGRIKVERCRPLQYRTEVQHSAYLLLPRMKHPAIDDEQKRNNAFAHRNYINFF